MEGTVTVARAVSADGTSVGYELLGSGPAIVLVQGAMGTAYTFRELAMALADTFTVVVPDRRGRGLSPHPFTPSYAIDDDVNDLDAVMTATGARYVFGLSSGGDVTLRAALALSRIEKIAVFEPAIFLDGVPRKGIEKFDRYAADGDLAGMLITGMKLAELGPAAMRFMPDWTVKPMISGIIKAEAQSGSGEYAPMAELAVAFQYDFAIAKSMDGTIGDFRALMQPTLLLGGSKSPKYLGRALDQLERIIPNVCRVELEGLDHAGSWNVDPQRNAHGNPGAVAVELKKFFG